MIKKLIAQFRGKYPDAKIVFEETSNEGTFDVSIGDLVSMKLDAGRFATAEEALEFAFQLAGFGLERTDADGDATGSPGSDDEPKKSETEPAGEAAGVQGTPAKKRGRPKKPVADESTDAAAEPTMDDASANSDKALVELSKAKDTVCQRAKGAYISQQQKDMIEGKKIGDLQRGFIRLIAVSGNKGPSPWSIETVEAAKLIMKS